MNLKTRYSLWKIKKSISPNLIFKAKLQKDLDKAWDEKYEKVGMFNLGVMYKAGAMAVVALVLLGSGGAYAYNSPDITEGNILYPVKKAIENIEEITKTTPEARARFFLKKIERREAERERLNKTEVENHSIELEKEDATSTEIENTDAEDSKEIDSRIEKIDKSIEEAEDRLEKVNEDFSNTELEDVKFQDEVKAKIEKRLEKRKERLEKASEILKIRSERLQEKEDNNIQNRQDESEVRDTHRGEKAGEQVGD
jgi:hypothetical protein